MHPFAYIAPQSTYVLVCRVQSSVWRLACTLTGWRGGGGSIARKTPDKALYSIYVSTLCSDPSFSDEHC